MFFRLNTKTDKISFLLFAIVITIAFRSPIALLIGGVFGVCIMVFLGLLHYYIEAEEDSSRYKQQLYSDIENSVYETRNLVALLFFCFVLSLFFC